ncbi:transcriptional regulator, LysR family [Methanobacterium lacus]|uniref:Transcriptional regulator, LysR family n=2 Tax=Methanobacterium lacus (strain AL-21) TaxID=877455 RepID=F0T7Q4_METLA|nr:transcriptional regulator, LysR family [Methanobacterium lacus]
MKLYVIIMNYDPKLGMVINGQEFSYKIFETLECIAKTYSQREAAKKLGISHSVLNRRIKESEEKINSKLVETTGAGSGLTENGHDLLNKYKSLMKRLEERKKPVICGGFVSTGLMEALIEEYDLNATVLRTNDMSALELSDKDMVDILALDDPVTAFIYDLDIIPVAYDHLVLVGDSAVNDISDLNGKDFVEIPNSSQRLAWNTMDNMGIDYNIVQTARSPQTALNAVKNNSELFTFLNNSFTEGSDVIKNETKHIVGVVLLNKTNSSLKNFVKFVVGEAHQTIENNGFSRI